MSGRYIGETTRHLSIRISSEHLTIGTSHIFKHLQESQNCKQLCDETWCEIMDTAKGAFALKLKEENMHRLGKPQP